MLLISHRARGFGFPENSEAALSAALKSATSEVEIDLYRSASGEYLASHWPLWLTGQRGKMSLQELIDCFRGSVEGGSQKGLRLDIKSVGGEDLLLKRVLEAKILASVTFMSRHVEALAAILRQAPVARISQSIVLSGVSETVDWFLYRSAIESGEKAGINRNSVTLFSLLGSYSNKIVEEALSNASEVVVCVSSTTDLNRLKALGVQAFLAKEVSSILSS